MTRLARIDFAEVLETAARNRVAARAAIEQLLYYTQESALALAPGAYGIRGR